MKTKMIRRMLSMCLVLTLFVSAIPIFACAEGEIETHALCKHVYSISVGVQVAKYSSTQHKLTHGDYYTCINCGYSYFKANGSISYAPHTWDDTGRTCIYCSYHR